MATKTISQLTAAAAVDNGDLFEVAHPDGLGGYTSNKEAMSAIAAHIGTAVNFSGLNTTSKNLVGAVNESFLHPFSTTEHVIGTWIDGSTVYEKTIDIGYLLNNAAKSVAHGISNIGVIIEWSGGIITDSGALAPLPYIHVDGLQYSIAVVATSTDVTVTTKSDRTTWYAYITLRYTKSQST